MPNSNDGIDTQCALYPLDAGKQLNTLDVLPPCHSIPPAAKHFVPPQKPNMRFLQSCYTPDSHPCNNSDATKQKNQISTRAFTSNICPFPHLCKAISSAPKHPNADLKAYHNYQNCILPQPANVSALQNPFHIHLNQNNKPVSGLRIPTLKSIRLLLKPTFNLIKAPNS